MIASVILLSLILVMLGLCVYIMGIVSAKLDMMVTLARMFTEREKIPEDRVKKQFMNMMNYSVGNKGDEDE